MEYQEDENCARTFKSLNTKKMILYDAEAYPKFATHHQTNCRINAQKLFQIRII